MQQFGIPVPRNLFQTSLQDPEAAGNEIEWAPCLPFYDPFAINLQFDAKKKMKSLGMHAAFTAPFSKQGNKIIKEKHHELCLTYWTQGLKMEETHIMIKSTSWVF